MNAADGERTVSGSCDGLLHSLISMHNELISLSPAAQSTGNSNAKTVANAEYS